MTQRERQILQLIEANPMISQQTIADELNITRSSVAVHISNLMNKGHIAGRGYVLRSGSYVVVVGGVNVAIRGRAFGPMADTGTTPGTVQLSPSGVGRNVAHNLSLMGTDVRLLTAYGDDVHGQKITASCSELGIDLSHARQITGGSTSTCVYLTDHTGATVMSISDMEICKKITPTYLAGHLGLLQNAQAVFCDANIPEESLIYLAENCTAPLFCDPVSTAKAEKMQPILGKIHTLKPNLPETELITGIKITNDRDLETAANKLLDMGVRQVFITLGERGIYAASRERQMLLPPPAGAPVNVAGTGDAVSAALVWAHLEGLDLKEMTLAGLAAWAITAESTETVNPAMSATAVKTRAKHR